MKNEDVITCYVNKKAESAEGIIYDNNTGLRETNLHASSFILYLKGFSFLMFFFLFVCHAHAQENIEGKASYYSNSLHGRRMSSGKKYHRDSLTCAHRTLPFGTKLKVTNPSNGKEIVVEVADRGPYSHSRVIDLSYAAARELGIIANGVKYVQIEVLKDDIVPPYNANTRPFDIPEMEYGMAGVCYEFIPEWSDDAGVDEKSVRSPNPPSSKKVKTQGSRPRAQSGTSKQGPAEKNAKQQDKEKHLKEKSTEKKKEQGGHGWKSFFDKLRSWGGSLLE